MENGLNIQVLVNGELASVYDRTDDLRSAPRKCVLFCGICHLISCITSVVTQTLFRYFHTSTSLLDPNSIGIGWYSGLVFGVTGGLGIYTSGHMTKCSLTSFLVMSVISSIICVPLLFVATMGLGQFQSAHASFLTYLLPLQIVISILEAVVSIVGSCISCHGTCCAQQITLKPIDRES